MPSQELICPGCSSRLTRPESMRDGDLVACPRCATAFRASGRADRITDVKPAGPALDDVEVIEVGPAEEEEEVLFVVEQGPRRKMKESERMKRTYQGLGFLHAKFLCILAGMLFAALSLIAPFVGGRGLVVAVGCLSLPLSAAAPLLGLTGALLCFWVPRRSHARLLIQVSFALDAGSTLIAGLGIVLSLLGGFMAMAGAVLLFLATIGSIGACVSFMLFLRALAAYLRDRGSEREAMSVMSHWLVMTVLAPLLLAPLALGAVYTSQRSILGAICSLSFIAVISLTFLVYFFKAQLRLLQLIATIRARIDSSYDFD
jgi:hypothetical protein